jgi:hypothetical protein
MMVLDPVAAALYDGTAPFATAPALNSDNPQ